MNNKSLAFRNKLYLFLSLVISFLILLYLIYFLINGERGVISFFTINNQQIELQNELKKIKFQNDFFVDRVQRLQINTIDLDYLDEQIRLNTGYISENELAIFIED